MPRSILPEYVDNIPEYRVAILWHADPQAKLLVQCHALREGCNQIAALQLLLQQDTVADQDAGAVPGLLQCKAKK